MKANLKLILPMLAVFAAGIVVGAWWKSAEAPEPVAAEKSFVVAKERVKAIAEAPVDTVTVGGDAVKGSSEAAVPEPQVEVTVDASPAPEPEVVAAHRARREKRAAAKAERRAMRRDFLASLNLDLLTPAEKKLHTEYAEAVAARDAAQAEIAALRAKGEDVPEELQQRFTEAASVTRADAEAEHAILRAAAARASGVDEAQLPGLLSNLKSVDALFRR